jgi:hypothetical protein
MMAPRMDPSANIKLTVPGTGPQLLFEGITVWFLFLHEANLSIDIDFVNPISTKIMKRTLGRPHQDGLRA